VTIDVMEKDYPEVDLSHMYVDNAAMQLIRWPKQFDTIGETDRCDLYAPALFFVCPVIFYYSTQKSSA